MKNVYVFGLLLVAGAAFADTTLKNEGTTVGPVNTINCVGEGINCTRSGATAIVNVTGGGGEVGEHTHAPATTSVDGFLSATDKTKLDGVAIDANNYVHPANHPASIITEDASRRFVTDAEKATWNDDADTIYTHPANHPASIITGTLPVANGGTGYGTASDHAVLVGKGGIWSATTIPSCDSVREKLYYNSFTFTFSCETDDDTKGSYTFGGSSPFKYPTQTQFARFTASQDGVPFSLHFVVTEPFNDDSCLNHLEVVEESSDLMICELYLNQGYQNQGDSSDAACHGDTEPEPIKNGETYIMRWGSNGDCSSSHMGNATLTVNEDLI